MDSTAQQMLFHCICYEKVDRVRKLVAQDVHVGAVDEDGYSPLHKAVLGGNLEIFRTLMDAGVDVNVVDSAGYTPLACAVTFNRTDISRQLLDAGAVSASKPTWPTGEKYLSPFQYAMRMGSGDLAWTLFEHFSEDPNQTTKSGESIEDLVKHDPEKLKMLRAMQTAYAIRTGVDEAGGEPQVSRAKKLSGMTPL